jgi:hypothetical protein
VCTPTGAPGIFQEHGDSLYWTADDPNSSSTDQLWSVKKAGGAPKLVGTSPSGDINHLGIAGTDAYLLVDCSNLYGLPLSGGTPYPIATHGCNVWGRTAMAVAKDAAYAYYSFLTLSDTTEIWRTDLSSGDVVKLSMDLNVSELVVAGDTLYYAHPGSCTSSYHGVCNGGVVGAMNLSSKAITKIVSMSQLAPGLQYESLGSLIADGTSIYFQVTETNGVSMSVYKVSTNGDTPLQLAKLDPVYSSILGIDDKYVYFEADSQIARVAR